MNHDLQLNNKDFSLFARLATAAIIAIISASSAAMPDIARLFLCAAAVIIAAYDLFIAVFKIIFKLDLFNERFLILIALIISFAGGKYVESVLGAIFFQISNFLFIKLKFHAHSLSAGMSSTPEDKKLSRMNAFLSKALHYYVPAVILLALMLSFIPLCFVKDISPWLSRASALLFVCSPCAITFSISISSAFTVCRIAHDGLALNSASAADSLAAVNTIVFDNSPALAATRYSLNNVMPVPGLSEHNLLRLASYAALSTRHPSAPILLAAYGEEIDPEDITGQEQIAGLGVLAHVRGLVISAGNLAMMDKLGLKNAAEALSSSASAIHIAVNGTYAGCVLISAKADASARKAVETLNSIGINRIILFSSESTKTTARAAHLLGINEYFYDCSLEEKSRHLEKLLAETFPEETLGYIGTEPVLLQMADIGISPGKNFGQCDAFLVNDDPCSIAEAIVSARHGHTVALQSLLFSALLKLLILILSFIGIIPFWLTVLADSGLAIIAMLNSARAGK